MGIEWLLQLIVQLEEKLENGTKKCQSLKMYNENKSNHNQVEL